MNARTIAWGALFGFVLSRAGATAYDAIAGMFLLRDLHLVGVIGVAIAGSALGFVWLRRHRPVARDGKPLALAAKPWSRAVIPGGLLFGAGWGLAGTCPGTALAQIGEGRLAGLITFAGILLGAWLEQRLRARVEDRPKARPREVAAAPTGTATASAT